MQSWQGASRLLHLLNRGGEEVRATAICGALLKMLPSGCQDSFILHAITTSTQSLTQTFTLFLICHQLAEVCSDAAIVQENVECDALNFKPHGRGGCTFRQLQTATAEVLGFLCFIRVVMGSPRDGRLGFIS